MTGYLTTHVLDTTQGCPAGGIEIELFKIENDLRIRKHIKAIKTNGDGRTDEEILPPHEFETGVYELVFLVGPYLAASSAGRHNPRFLDAIPIRFGMPEHLHYHVPLLLSPFGYSTYRGS